MNEEFKEKSNSKLLAMLVIIIGEENQQHLINIIAFFRFQYCDEQI